MNDSIYIVMPAYNEEGNIEKTVKEWYGILEGKSEVSRMVIADFGSKDKTHDILLSMKENGYPQLEILENKNQFHGPKVLDLYKYAIDQGIDYIFQTDSDGQTDPTEFDAFWELRSRYDGIFGNRTIRGDGKDRAFVEKVVCFLLKLFFKVNVPDANAPFRLMKTDVVKKYIYKMPNDYNLPNIMMTTYFAHYKEKMLFKEISFKPRTAGVNSVNMKRIIKIGWKALGDFRALRKGMR
ncbi:MAG: glycosyltransferase family 2 protein [Lachnospiraceae bacterium]|nr:glycosyltransferase family 2 protein [Lachnospiraceae bacterium]MDY5741402.1 glycosyltransferase family 2 protein [Lachnospiraceae bacterium]